MKKAFTQRRQNDQSHLVHKPYQINYWIVFFSIFLFCGMSSYSFPNIPSPSSTEQVNTWTLMQSESGVDIYYEEYILNSNTYLRIKFINSTSNSVDFDWTLKKDTNILFQNVNQIIQGNSEVVIDEAAYTIQMGSNNIITSYYFEINLN